MTFHLKGSHVEGLAVVADQAAIHGVRSHAKAAREKLEAL